MTEKSECWYVYLIQCSDHSLYTGISKDVQRRFEQHRDKKGAKYFYGRRPLKVVYQESFLSKGEALSREMAIKKMSPQAKKILVKLK